MKMAVNTLLSPFYRMQRYYLIFSNGVIPKSAQSTKKERKTEREEEDQKVSQMTEKFWDVRRLYFSLC